MGFQKWNRVNPGRRTKLWYLVSSYQSAVATDYKVYFTWFCCILWHLSHVLAGIFFFPGLFLSMLFPRWCSLTTQATHPEAFSGSSAFRSTRVWKANLLMIQCACLGHRGAGEPPCLWRPQHVVEWNGSALEVPSQSQCRWEKRMPCRKHKHCWLLTLLSLRFFQKSLLKQTLFFLGVKQGLALTNPT